MNVGQLFVMLGLQVDKGQWDKGEKVISNLKSAATGLIAALGVRSIVSMVEHTTEAATHLISLSRAMGMTVEQTQEWGYVAQQSGSNLKELSVGMNMLERNLRLFSEGRGSKVLRDRFTELGLTRHGVKEAIAAGPEGTQNIVLQIADGIHKMDEGMRKATETQLFGVRAGRAMLADIERGSEGLKELFARRRAMGEITEEQAQSMRELGNRLKDVHTAYDALKSQVVAKLAPLLLDLADRAMQWIAANKDIISGALEIAVRGVAAAFEAVATVISTISDLVHEAMGGDTGAQAIIIGIATAITMVLIPALWGMVAPILAATWPLLLIAAAVALVAYGILEVVKHADEIGDSINAALSAVGDAAKTVGGWFSWLGGVIIDGIGSALAFVRDLALRWVDNVSAKFALFWDSLKYGWESLKDAAQNAWDFITDKVTGFVDAVAGFGQRIIDGFKHAWEWVKQLTSDAIDWVTDKISNIPVLGWVGHKIGQAFDALSGTSAFADSPAGSAHTEATAASQIVSPGDGSGGVPGVTVGPTSVQINVNSVQEAKEAHDAFVQERDDNALRHAMRGVAGEVQ